MRRAVLLFALALGACDESSSDSGSKGSTTLDVECIGMSRREPIAGYYMIQTDVGGRCTLALSDTVYDPKNIELITQASLGEPNTATLLINYAGKEWFAREGTITFDEFETTRARGTYELEATSGDEKATMRGPIQYCEYGADPDCPYQSSALATLPFAVGFEDPDHFSADEAKSRASDCRVLIDRELEAVQVDLQLTIVNGLNVARWIDMCGPGTSIDNHFRFRARGVAGPGEWGPVAVSVANAGVDGGPGEYLPGFELRAPNLVFLGNCLAFTNKFWSAHPIDGTACSWRIEESPGRFELECTGARHFESASYFVDGDFRLAADCDVRYR